MFDSKISRRTVGAVVLGAVLATGAAIPGNAAPATAQTQFLHASATAPVTTTLTASATTLSQAPATALAPVPASAATLPGSPSTGTQGLPSLIIKFVQAALKFLGKAWSWLKNVIVSGYQAFLTHFWNKIPGWIKTIVGWG